MATGIPTYSKHFSLQAGHLGFLAASLESDLPLKCFLPDLDMSRSVIQIWALVQVEAETSQHIDIENFGVLWEVESQIASELTASLIHFDPSIALQNLYENPAKWWESRREEQFVYNRKNSHKLRARILHDKREGELLVPEVILFGTCCPGYRAPGAPARSLGIRSGSAR